MKDYDALRRKLEAEQIERRLKGRADNPDAAKLLARQEMEFERTLKLSKQGERKRKRLFVQRRKK